MKDHHCLKGGEHVINTTFMDAISVGRDQVPAGKKQQESGQFAAIFNQAAQPAKGRREITEQAMERPEPGVGRRDWGQQRSRAEGSKERSAFVTKDQRNNSPKAEDPLQELDEVIVQWIQQLSADAAGLLGELASGELLLTEEVKDLLIQWLEVAPKLDEIQPQLKSVIEDIMMMLQTIELPSEENEEQQYAFARLILQFNDELNKFSSADIKTDPQLHLEKTLQEKVESIDVSGIRQNEHSAEVKQSQDQPPDVTQKTPLPVTSEMPSYDQDQAGNRDQTRGQEQTESKMTLISTASENQEQTETVIPFSLHQIDSLLHQNTLIQELDQQKSTLQQDIFQQVVQKIQVLQGANENFVTMHLVPEHLGKLTIQLTADSQQMMTARIYAETPLAKELIESNFGQLKDALSGKGVNLTTLEVFVGQDPESSEKQREFHYQQARAKRGKPFKISDAERGIEAAVLSESISGVNPYLKNDGFDRLG